MVVEGKEPDIERARACRQASVVAIVVGVSQIIGAMVVALIRQDEVSDGAIWFALSGAAYLGFGIPVRWGRRPAMLATAVLAGSHAVMYAAMAILAVIAGLRSGEQSRMTMGVLLFGSIACLHILVLRLLAQARGDRG